MLDTDHTVIFIHTLAFLSSHLFATLVWTEISQYLCDGLDTQCVICINIF